MPHRKGSRVRELTKKVGAHGRAGTIIDIRDDGSIEVEWDDGHTSTLRGAQLVAEKKAKSATS